MPNAAVMFTILPVSAVVALLVTVAIAYFLGRRLKQQLLAILIAGFALPVAMMLSALYAVSTDQPDGPPPGMMLLGALSVVAVVTPITLILSGLAVRRARR